MKGKDADLEATGSCTYTKLKPNLEKLEFNHECSQVNFGPNRLS